MFALVTDDTIQAVGRLPRSARRLDTGQWILGLPDAPVDLQQACGWYEVTDADRPDETETTTHDRTFELVDGIPTVVWTERPLTDEELFQRELFQAPDTLTTVAARLNPDIPELWAQPVGAHDAYLPGAIVLDEAGDRWRNDLGVANVWPLDNPHAKWTNLDAEEPDGPQPWVQPEGAHDAYQTGDRVTHQGQTWESTINDNVWEPGAAGTEGLWVAV